MPTELFVQAFGRNDFPEEMLYKVADEHYRQCRQDPATVAAFRARSFQPGQPNIDLARALSFLLANRPRLKAWVQWEVAVAMDPDEYARFAERIVVIWPSLSSGYFDSVKVLNEAIRLGLGRSGLPVMVLAHQAMVVRLLLMVRRRLHCDVVAAPSHVTAFDDDSVQAHTKYRLIWYPREAIGRWIVFPICRQV